MKQILAALFAALVSTLAIAQPSPSKPVKMVIPWPPGGGNDILGRMLADALGCPSRRNELLCPQPQAGQTNSVGQRDSTSAASHCSSLPYRLMNSAIESPG